MIGSLSGETICRISDGATILVMSEMNFKPKPSIQPIELMIKGLCRVRVSGDCGVGGSQTMGGQLEALEVLRTFW